MHGLLRRAQFLANLGKGRRIVIVTVDVAQKLGQFLKSALVDAAGMLQAVLCTSK